MTSSLPYPMGKDEEINALALEAQRWPLNSRERRQAFNRLLLRLSDPGMLCRPRPKQFVGQYEDIYANACNQLFRYLWEKLDVYDPKRRTFRGWANHLLKLRFFTDAAREETQHRPSCNGNNSMIYVDAMENGWDQFLPSESPDGITPEDILKYLEDDPRGILASWCITSMPHANFRDIALRRHRDGITWKAISAELNIGVPTLSNFYQRCLPRFKEQLRVDGLT